MAVVIDLVEPAQESEPTNTVADEAVARLRHRGSVAPTTSRPRPYRRSCLDPRPVHPFAILEVEKTHQIQLIVGVLAQGRSSRAGRLEMSEVSLPLLHQRRLSILVGGVGEEDVIEHIGLLVVGGVSFPTKQDDGSYLDPTRGLSVSASWACRRPLSTSTPSRRRSPLKSSRAGTSVSASTPTPRARSARVFRRTPSCGVVVSRDVEPSQTGGQFEGGKVVRRERGCRRQQRHDLPEREHSLQSSPTIMTSTARPNRTALPSNRPMARRGVETGALLTDAGSTHVRCTPMIVPSSAVTAEMIAGQASRTRSRRSSSSPRYQQRGWKRSASQLVRCMIPRLRRYASAKVPAIGLAMAQSLRAASAEPLGAGALAATGGSAGAATGSAAPPRRPRGTPRARNSRGSRRAGRRARPRPHRSSARRPQGRTPARSAARTSTGRACCAHRPPSSSGPDADPSTDNGGKPPRRRARGAVQARKRRGASRDPPRGAEVMLRRNRKARAATPPSAGPQHNHRRNIIGPLAGNAGGREADEERAPPRAASVAGGQYRPCLRPWGR